ncbi:class II fructose-bisphosphate aldolase [Candidatus Nomurabacteria bacterium]|nr:class II fructose-bisphosphate aldolase [Candidatus Nomurabacteria bacterium]
MLNLRESLKEAIAKQVAIGHFNISNLEGLWAIFRAAQGLSLPVIIGVSEGERDFVGTKQVVALVKSLREEFNYPVFLNADHTYSFERVKEAVDAGFDSVIFDGSKLSLAENIKITKQCVDYARSVSSEILVEGELGYIGTSSKLLDAIPEGVSLNTDDLVKSEIAKQFVEETGVDLLAPAVGNIHGMLKNGKEPALNIERIREISKVSGVPLVLHGGSGNSEADFKMAIKNGVAIVHINTELRVAYRDALKITLQENLDEVAPYKILKPSVMAMQKVVEKKLRLFSNL